MSTLAPVRARQSYRHEAFLWQSRDEFVRGLVPFVREGLDADEAVMVAVIPEHAEWIRDALGAGADDVHFVDMTQLGRNPARIISAWQTFLDDWSGWGRPARGIGEPIWPGRRPEEIAECQLHEALLNLAVDPELPFWLICPYDEQQLDEDIIAEAGRSHPVLSTALTYHGSPSYRGHAHAQEMFNAELPVVGGLPAETVVSRYHEVGAAAEYVTLEAATADLWSHKILALADAVRSLSATSLERGAEWVRIQLWNRPDVVICDVCDPTTTNDLLIGRRNIPTPGQDALWSANQNCDLVQARSSGSGTTVRLHLRK